MTNGNQLFSDIYRMKKFVLTFMFLLRREVGRHYKLWKRNVLVTVDIHLFLLFCIIDWLCITGCSRPTTTDSTWCWNAPRLAAHYQRQPAEVHCWCCGSHGETIVHLAFSVFFVHLKICTIPNRLVKLVRGFVNLCNLFLPLVLRVDSCWKEANAKAMAPS